MITAIALDDEPLPLEILEKYAAKTGFIALQRTLTKVLEAQHYLKNFPVDLLFLDIQMPQLSGIDFYKNSGADKMVIFTTAYSEYAIEGFNLNALDYLMKPYSYDRFLLASQRAKEQYDLRKKRELGVPSILQLRVDYSLVSISLPEIICIESFGDYLRIQLANQKSITVRMTMKGIIEKLPPNDFVRVHRSFILPLHKIKAVRNKIIYIDSLEIPIGNNYEEYFYSIYKR